MKAEPALREAHQRLKAEALELARANEALRRELDEQKSTLNAIKSSGLRSLASMFGDWYWEQDAEHRFVEFAADQGHDEFNDKPIHDAVGGYWWELPGVVPLCGSWDEHRAVLDSHEPFRGFECVRKAADGTSTWISISGMPMFDSANRFTGYQGTARDISATRRAGYGGAGSDIMARKLTENALRASEARFRTVVAALAEGVVLRDADGKIIDCNASAERILGRPLSEMRGQKSVGSGWERLREDSSLLPEEDLPSTVATRTGKAQSNAVVCYRKPDGNILWSLINVQPLRQRVIAASPVWNELCLDIRSRIIDFNPFSDDCTELEENGFQADLLKYPRQMEYLAWLAGHLPGRG